MNKLHKYEIGGLIGIIILFFIFELETFLNIFNLESIRIFIDSFGVYAPLFYVLFSICLLLLTFPMSVIVVFSGIIFGMIKGFFLSFLTLSIASSIAFILSRGFSKKFKHQARKQKSTYISRLVEKIKKNVDNHPFLAIFLPIIFFLPYIEICYASGLVKNLKGFYFFFAMFFANLIQVFVFIFLGDSLNQNFNIFLITIGVFILFLLIPRFFKIFFPKFHSKKLN